MCYQQLKELIEKLFYLLMDDCTILSRPVFHNMYIHYNCKISIFALNNLKKACSALLIKINKYQYKYQILPAKKFVHNIYNSLNQ